MSYNERRSGTEQAGVDCGGCGRHVIADVTWDGAEREWDCPDCGARHWEEVDDDGQVTEL